MNDAFAPKNKREGHPHIRGLVNFLISLFRASALLPVMEFLILGQVTKHRLRIFQEFYWAEDEVSGYDETLWSLRKTELLVAMGLLLGPTIFADCDQNGNLSTFHSSCTLGIMEHRQWLSDIWIQHNGNESVNFNRCQTCPCLTLARVQQLWQTPMTRDDYIRTLAANPWIWAVEPGWSMEGRLRGNQVAFEKCTYC